MGEAGTEERGTGEGYWSLHMSSSLRRPIDPVPWIGSDRTWASGWASRLTLCAHVCVWGVQDVYELPQKMGKYLTIPRTEGVSTTDIGTNTGCLVDH